MKITASITRPANTTAYSIGDVINENGVTIPLELVYGTGFSNPYVLNNHVLSSNETGAPAFDVYFFSQSFTIAADNAAFAPSDTEMKDYYLGRISHTTWKALATNKFSDQKPDAPILIPNSGSGASVFVVFVAVDAFTPASGEVWTIKTDIVNETN